MKINDISILCFSRSEFEPSWWRRPSRSQSWKGCRRGGVTKTRMIKIAKETTFLGCNRQLCCRLAEVRLTNFSLPLGWQKYICKWGENLQEEKKHWQAVKAHVGPWGKSIGVHPGHVPGHLFFYLLFLLLLGLFFSSVYHHLNSSNHSTNRSASEANKNSPILPFNSYMSFSGNELNLF